MKNEELSALLADMSIEEKIGQLVQIPGAFLEDESFLTGPGLEFGITDEELGMIGSTLSIVGAKKIRKIQDKAMSKQPHHIPMLFMADIINGYRSVFPIPLAQGCSFDTKLVERLAAMSARESAADGLHVTFSPMVDLVRDARWGRVMESTGEDAFLNGALAAATVEGYQGKDVSDGSKIAACVKHFAAYSAPEGGRDYNTVELSKRTILDDYLPGYEAAIKAGSEMVMTSFNTLDGICATANKEYMQDILRKKWGFEGVLISDWAAIAELIPNGMAENDREAAALAMDAGVDIDMSTPVYLKQLKGLVEQNVISMEDLDRACLRVLTLKNHLGLFEDPYHQASGKKANAEILSDDNRSLCREAAEQTMVLLRNKKNILPLPKKGKKIALIGPYAESKTLCGTWSIFADKKDVVTVADGMQNKDYANQYLIAKGCPLVDPGKPLYGFEMGNVVHEYKPDENCQELLDDAVKKAEKADVVVLLLGEHPAQTGEGGSQADIRLPKMQRRLLREVSKVNSNLVVVLFGGRPLDIRDVCKNAGAVVAAWLPGIEGGNALANLLYGDVNFTGKLSMSWPYSVGQVPVHYDRFPTGRPYNGDITNRFQSKYNDIPVEPLFAFGHGLSYAKFEYSNIVLSSDKMGWNESITAEVQLSNVGACQGVETVQMYIRDTSASTVRPIKELKGFKKVRLNPGATALVSFTIDREMLKFTRSDWEFEAEVGRFILYIGSDSDTLMSAEFELLP